MWSLRGKCKGPEAGGTGLGGGGTGGGQQKSEPWGGPGSSGLPEPSGEFRCNPGAIGRARAEGC